MTARLLTLVVIVRLSLKRREAMSGTSRAPVMSRRWARRRSVRVSRRGALIVILRSILV